MISSKVGVSLSDKLLLPLQKFVSLLIYLNLSEIHLSQNISKIQCKMDTLNLVIAKHMLLLKQNVKQ